MIATSQENQALVIILVIACLVGIVLAIYLLLLPIKIAKERNHPSIDAIRVCSILSLFLPILWFVAIIWAYTAPHTRKDSR